MTTPDPEFESLVAEHPELVPTRAERAAKTAAEAFGWTVFVISVLCMTALLVAGTWAALRAVFG